MKEGDFVTHAWSKEIGVVLWVDGADVCVEWERSAQCLHRMQYLVPATDGEILKLSLRKLAG